MMFVQDYDLKSKELDELRLQKRVRYFDLKQLFFDESTVLAGQHAMRKLMNIFCDFLYRSMSLNWNIFSLH